MESPIINSNQVAATPVLLTPKAAPKVCARQLILERVRELVKHETGTRSGEDIEALHDMRVASRRLREALEIFEFCFTPKLYDRLYTRVRRITRALGRARDEDVTVDYFSKLLAGSQDLIQQIALQDMLRRRVKQQKHRRAEMQHDLDKVRPADLASRFEKIFDRLAQTPASQRPRGPRTALQLARRLFAQRLREVFARQRLLKGETDVTGLHNLRIAVKKLRYAMETLDFAAGTPVKENLKFFKKLQTVLGDLHDRDVFAAMTQRRIGKLKKQSFSAHLLNGYQMLAANVAGQRQDFYAEYVKLFGQAKIQEWRSRIIPPALAKTAPPSKMAAETAVPA